MRRKEAKSGPRTWRALAALVVTTLAMLAAPSFIGSPAPAGAATGSTAPQGCGTLPSGLDVYLGAPGACTVPPTTTPYHTFGDQQKIDLAMGPNSVFRPHDPLGGDLVAIECEYNSGSGQPGNPPSADFCSAPTLAGDFPFAVKDDGSFDYSVQNGGDLVTVWALPNMKLGPATITCDATHACVWYVGENYNAFTAPHVFSNPFYVAASPDDAGGLPAAAVVVIVLIGAGVVVGIVILVRRRRHAA